MLKRGLFSQVPNDPPTISVLASRPISEEEALKALSAFVERTTATAGGPFAPQEEQFARVRLMHETMLKDVVPR